MNTLAQTNQQNAPPVWNLYSTWEEAELAFKLAVERARVAELEALASAARGVICVRSIQRS